MCVASRTNAFRVSVHTQPDLSASRRQYFVDSSGVSQKSSRCASGGGGRSMSARFLLISQLCERKVCPLLMSVASRRCKGANERVPGGAGCGAVLSDTFCLAGRLAPTHSLQTTCQPHTFVTKDHVTKWRRAPAMNYDVAGTVFYMLFRLSPLSFCPA